MNETETAQRSNDKASRVVGVVIFLTIVAAVGVYYLHWSYTQTNAYQQARCIKLAHTTYENTTPTSPYDQRAKSLQSDIAGCMTTWPTK